ERGQGSGRDPEKLAGQQEGRQNGSDVGERARKPRGKLGESEEPEGGRHAPVGQRRFLVEAGVVQARLDPVAAFEHLPGDERVTGLGRADQGANAESRKREESGEDTAARQRQSHREARPGSREPLPPNVFRGARKARYAGLHPTAAKTPPSPPRAHIHEICARKPSKAQSSSDCAKRASGSPSRSALGKERRYARPLSRNQRCTCRS